MVTRRALGGLLLLPALQEAGAADSVPRGLRVSGEEALRLAQEGERAREQARWLEDLPLEGVAPGFVFVPR